LKGSFLEYLGLITQLGLVIVIAITIGVFTGVFLDNLIKSGFTFTIIFSVFGIIGGFTAAYQLIKGKR